MEARSCIFCHTQSTVTALEEKGYQGKQCTPCNLIFVSPRPSQAEIANLYGHDEAHLSAESHINNKLPKTLHANHTLKLIKKYRKTGKLLEIGAGAGYFLQAAKKKGFQVEGLELNPTQADFITKNLGISCQTTDLKTFAQQGKKFDVIYHCDVVSHFFEPIEELNAIRSMLSDNGIMVFETGNIADISPRWYNLFTAFQYPDHLFFFGEDSIKKLLAVTDFELVALYRYTIVPQLMLIKRVHQIKNKKADHIKLAHTTPIQTKNQRLSPLYSMLKNGYHYGQHFMRYKLGSLITSKKLPQTFIIIARKKH